MARQARRISPINMYHIILRGINKQIIFTEDSDYLYFLKELLFVTEETEIKVHSYCLMNNHVHMLLEGDMNEIGTALKRFQIRFVMWYNKKYERIGHLFQNRYKSVPVDTEAQFLTVLRYILQNPMNAGLETEPGNYPWTSYRACLSIDSGQVKAACRYAKMITATQILRSFFKNGDELENYLKIPGHTVCAEYYSVCNMTDEEGMQTVYILTQAKSPYEFQQMEISERNKNLIRLKQAGLSAKQINRYTGVSVRTITNVCNKELKEKKEQ